MALKTTTRKLLKTFKGSASPKYRRMVKAINRPGRTQAARDIRATKKVIGSKAMRSRLAG